MATALLIPSRTIKPISLGVDAIKLMVSVCVRIYSQLKTK